jgi:hypothetical protein
MEDFEQEPHNSLESQAGTPASAENPNELFQEVSPEDLEMVREMGQELSTYMHIKNIAADETVREGLKAVFRTLMNSGIAAADTYPIVGDIISWGADAGKVFNTTDLTPDVPKSVAWGTELAEPFTGGVLPSHIIETVMQFSHDKPRIIAAWKRCEELLKQEDTDYTTNKTEIDKAADTFDKKTTLAI